MLLTAALEGLALALAAVALAGALDGALAVGFDLDFEDDGVLVETGINN